MSTPEAVRDSNILMCYRGAPESRERALTSGQNAVKDYLDQFDGDEKIGAALTIASTLGEIIQETCSEDETATFYAKEIANPGVLKNLAENVEGLRWMTGVANVGTYLLEPVPETE